MTQEVHEQHSIVDQLFAELKRTYYAGQRPSYAQLKLIAPSLSLDDYKLLVQRFMDYMREQEVQTFKEQERQLSQAYPYMPDHVTEDLLFFEQSVFSQFARFLVQRDQSIAATVAQDMEQQRKQLMFLTSENSLLKRENHKLQVQIAALENSLSRLDESYQFECKAHQQAQLELNKLRESEGAGHLFVKLLKQHLDSPEIASISKSLSQSTAEALISLLRKTDATGDSNKDMRGDSFAESQAQIDLDALMGSDKSKLANQDNAADMQAADDLFFSNPAFAQAMLNDSLENANLNHLNHGLGGRTQDLEVANLGAKSDRFKATESAKSQQVDNETPRNNLFMASELSKYRHIKVDDLDSIKQRDYNNKINDFVVKHDEELVNALSAEEFAATLHLESLNSVPNTADNQPDLSESQAKAQATSVVSGAIARVEPNNAGADAESVVATDVNLTVGASADVGVGMDVDSAAGSDTLSSMAEEEEISVEPRGVEEVSPIVTDDENSGPVVKDAAQLSALNDAAQRLAQMDSPQSDVNSEESIKEALAAIISSEPLVDEAEVVEDEANNIGAQSLLRGQVEQPKEQVQTLQVQEQGQSPSQENTGSLTVESLSHQTETGQNSSANELAQQTFSLLPLGKATIKTQHAHKEGEAAQETLQGTHELKSHIEQGADKVGLGVESTVEPTGLATEQATQAPAQGTAHTPQDFSYASSLPAQILATLGNNGLANFGSMLGAGQHLGAREQGNLGASAENGLSQGLSQGQGHSQTSSAPHDMTHPIEQKIDALVSLSEQIFADKDNADVTSMEVEELVAAAIERNIFSKEQESACRRLVVKLLFLGREAVYPQDATASVEEIVQAIPDIEQRFFAQAALTWPEQGGFVAPENEPNGQNEQVEQNEIAKPTEQAEQGQTSLNEPASPEHTEHNEHIKHTEQGEQTVDLMAEGTAKEQEGSEPIAQDTAELSSDQIAAATTTTNTATTVTFSEQASKQGLDTNESSESSGSAESSISEQAKAQDLDKNAASEGEGVESTSLTETLGSIDSAANSKNADSSKDSESGERAEPPASADTTDNEDTDIANQPFENEGQEEQEVITISHQPTFSFLGEDENDSAEEIEDLDGEDGSEAQSPESTTLEKEDSAETQGLEKADTEQSQGEILMFTIASDESDERDQHSEQDEESLNLYKIEQTDEQAEQDIDKGSQAGQQEGAQTPSESAEPTAHPESQDQLEADLAQGNSENANANVSSPVSTAMAGEDLAEGTQGTESTEANATTEATEETEATNATKATDVSTQADAGEILQLNITAQDSTEDNSTRTLTAVEPTELTTDATADSLTVLATDSEINKVADEGTLHTSSEQALHGTNEGGDKVEGVTGGTLYERNKDTKDSNDTLQQGLEESQQDKVGSAFSTTSNPSGNASLSISNKPMDFAALAAILQQPVSGMSKSAASVPTPVVPKSSVGSGQVELDKNFTTTTTTSNNPATTTTNQAGSVNANFLDLNGHSMQQSLQIGDIGSLVGRKSESSFDLSSHEAVTQAQALSWLSAAGLFRDKPVQEGGSISNIEEITSAFKQGQGLAQSEGGKGSQGIQGSEDIQGAGVGLASGEGNEGSQEQKQEQASPQTQAQSAVEQSNEQGKEQGNEQVNPLGQAQDSLAPVSGATTTATTTANATTSDPTLGIDHQTIEAAMSSELKPSSAEEPSDKGNNLADYNYQPAKVINSVPRSLLRDEKTLVKEITSPSGDDSIAAVAEATAKLESLVPFLNESKKEAAESQDILFNFKQDGASVSHVSKLHGEQEEQVAAELAKVAQDVLDVANELDAKSKLDQEAKSQVSIFDRCYEEIDLEKAKAKAQEYQDESHNDFVSGNIRSEIDLDSLQGRGGNLSKESTSTAGTVNTATNVATAATANTANTATMASATPVSTGTSTSHDMATSSDSLASQGQVNQGNAEQANAKAAEQEPQSVSEGDSSNSSSNSSSSHGSSGIKWLKHDDNEQSQGHSFGESAQPQASTQEVLGASTTNATVGLPHQNSIVSTGTGLSQVQGADTQAQEHGAGADTTIKEQATTTLADTNGAMTVATPEAVTENAVKADTESAVKTESTVKPESNDESSTDQSQAEPRDIFVEEEGNSEQWNGEKKEARAALNKSELIKFELLYNQVRANYQSKEHELKDLTSRLGESSVVSVDPQAIYHEVLNEVEAEFATELTDKLKAALSEQAEADFFPSQAALVASHSQTAASLVTTEQQAQSKDNQSKETLSSQDKAAQITVVSTSNQSSSQSLPSTVTPSPKASTKSAVDKHYGDEVSFEEEQEIGSFQSEADFKREAQAFEAELQEYAQLEAMVEGKESDAEQGKSSAQELSVSAKANNASKDSKADHVDHADKANGAVSRGAQLGQQKPQLTADLVVLNEQEEIEHVPSTISFELEQDSDKLLFSTPSGSQDTSQGMSSALKDTSTLSGSDTDSKGLVSEGKGSELTLDSVDIEGMFSLADESERNFKAQTPPQEHDYKSHIKWQTKDSVSDWESGLGKSSFTFNPYSLQEQESSKAGAESGAKNGAGSKGFSGQSISTDSGALNTSTFSFDPLGRSGESTVKFGPKLDLAGDYLRSTSATSGSMSPNPSDSSREERENQKSKEDGHQGSENPAQSQAQTQTQTYRSPIKWQEHHDR